VLARNISWPDG